MKTPSDSEKSNRKNVLLAVIAIVLIIILCGIYFSGQKASKPENSPHTERSAKKVDKVFTDARGDKTSSANEELLKKFNNVKFGDLKKDGLGGNTYTQIKAIFNSAPSRKTYSSKLAGVTVKFGEWQYDDMTITFFFVKNRVVGSDISSFRWKRRKTTFDRVSFKKLENGADKNAIFKKFGKPDELNQIKFRGKNKAIYMWFTGIKGKKGLMFRFPLQMINLPAKPNPDSDVIKKSISRLDKNLIEGFYYKDFGNANKNFKYIVKLIVI